MRITINKLLSIEIEYVDLTVFSKSPPSCIRKCRMKLTAHEIKNLITYYQAINEMDQLTEP